MEGLSQMADFFAERFDAMGWKTQKVDYAPESGVCVVCTNREAEHYDLMLIGHLDTVYAKGTVAERPFRIEGERAYGPGTADMKHGCLLMYYLMKELPEDINDKLNIVVVFNPDEEKGSFCSRKTYLEYAKKTDYVYVYEACDNGNGARCVERKGGAFAWVNFKGIAGHCGYMHTNGTRSAISEMGRWIVKLDSTLHSKERNTTVNIGVVEGGTQSNVVAEHAFMRADIRFSMPEELDRVKAVFDELMQEAKEHGIEVDLKLTTKPALKPTEEGWKYIEHLKELFKENGMEFIHEARGGFSDANIIAPCGPICIDGMGPAGAECHCDREYLCIDGVIPAFDFSNLMIRDLAENKER